MHDVRPIWLPTLSVEATGRCFAPDARWWYGAIQSLTTEMYFRRIIAYRQM
jgi:hypothetical protein